MYCIDKDISANQRRVIFNSNAGAFNSMFPKTNESVQRHDNYILLEAPA